jgi:hypothetical protein
MKDYDPDPRVPSGLLIGATAVCLVFIFVACYLAGAPL